MFGVINLKVDSFTLHPPLLKMKYTWSMNFALHHFNFKVDSLAFHVGDMICILFLSLAILRPHLLLRNLVVAQYLYTIVSIKT